MASEADKNGGPAGEAFVAMGFSLFSVKPGGVEPLGEPCGLSESAFLDDLNLRVLDADSAKPIEPAIWEEGGRGFEAFPIEVESGRMIAVRRLGEEFEARRDLLQRANDQSLNRRKLLKEVQKKEMLLRCIVHDLGSPLATVIMNLQRAARLIDDEKARWSVTTALEQAVRQRGMIRSVIDIFSAEIASLDLFVFDPESAPDVAASVRSIVDAHREMAISAGVRIELGAGTEGAAPVKAEAALLERVVENLLANAVRHAGAGTTVQISVIPEGKWLEVAVDDEGPGVPVGMEEAIFEPNVQSGLAAGQAGLGLFFCKRSVERWEGEIGCANREGGGARFWFRLRRPEVLAS